MNTGRHGSGSALHDHFSLLFLFTKSFTVWPGPAYSLFYMENGQDASGLLDLPSTKITMSQHSIQCSSVSALWPGRSRLGRVAWEDWSPEEGSFCLQQPEFLSPGGAYHWGFWHLLKIHYTKVSAFFVAQNIKYRSQREHPLPVTFAIKHRC